MVTDSFPFLHAARRLSLPYGDVLLFVECLAGIGDSKWKPTPHHIAAAERMTPDLQAQHVINAAWRNEADRRLNLNQDERMVPK